MTNRSNKRKLTAANLLIVILSGVFVALPPALAFQQIAPEASGAPRIRFVVIGDAGTGDANQLAVARQMVAEHDRRPYSFVLTVGDNTYLDSWKRIQEVFDIPYGEILKRGVKFYATLGNHDQKSAEEQIKYAPFNMGGKRYFSFAPAGDLVEFFTIDSQMVLKGEMPEQLVWLDQALRTSKARWKIAFFHDPPYSPGKQHGDDSQMISQVVPILRRHGVRVVLTGHDHIFAKLSIREGIDYFVCGSSAKLRSNGIRADYRGIEFGDAEFRGFMVVTLSPVEFEFSVINENGDVRFRGSVSLAYSANS